MELCRPPALCASSTRPTPSCNTPAYKLDAMELAPGADPLSPDSWTKLPQPVFTSGNRLYGNGHNAFFKSPDGTEDWSVFMLILTRTMGVAVLEIRFSGQLVGWTISLTCESPYLLVRKTGRHPASDEVVVAYWSRDMGW